MPFRTGWRSGSPDCPVPLLFAGAPGSAGHVECGLWITGGLASAHDDGVTHGKHTGQRQRGADERRRSPHAPRKMSDER